MNWRMILGLGVAIAAFVGSEVGANPTLQPAKAAAYKITPKDGGYAVELSAAAIQKIPSGATLEITLDDPARGTTTIRGKASKLSDTSFSIQTGQKFNFLPSTETQVKMRLSGGPRVKVTKTSSSCTGCPRDPEMLCDDPPACTACYCFL